MIHKNKISHLSVLLCCCCFLLTLSTTTINALTTQGARILFSSLLAQNYSYLGTFEIYTTSPPLPPSTTVSSAPNFKYECTIGVTNAYDFTVSSLSKNINLLSCDNHTNDTTTNSFNSSIFDEQVYRNMDSSSSAFPFVVSSINKYFDLIYANSNNQLANFTLSALPDPIRANEIFDSHQVGVPCLLEWNLTSLRGATTFVRFQILSLIDVAKDPLRRAQSILWARQNKTWYTMSDLHKDDSNSNNPDDADAASAVDYYTFDLVTYLGGKEQPDPDGDPAQLQLYEDTFEAYRVGVSKHIDAVYRLIDIKTNKMITNVTSGMLERGILLTLDEHLDRIQLAIQISTSIGVLVVPEAGPNGSSAPASDEMTQQDIDNIHLFYAEYERNTGAPVTYSWKNPWFNAFGSVNTPNFEEPYNVLRTWKITNVQVGRLAPPPFKLAAGMIALIILAVILLLGGAFYKIYQKMCEETKQGEDSRANDRNSRNPAIRGNVIRLQTGVNSDDRSGRYHHQGTIDNLHDLDYDNNNNNDDMNGDEGEFSSTEMQQRNNNINNTSAVDDENGSPVATNNKKSVTFSPRNINDDDQENNNNNIAVVAGNPSSIVVGEAMDAELATLHAIEAIRKSRKNQTQEQ